jgi:lysine/ornithine N-monooxygenase
VLIVGAGPYGISLSYDLHCQGIDFLIVGEPFSLWRRHVLNATTLRSDINASQIFARDNRFSWRAFLKRTYPPADAARISRSRIPVEVFRDYTTWILDQLPYRPVQQKVVRLSERGESAGGGFLAELTDGTRIAATKVVLASGIESHRVLPECLARLPEHLVFHSWRVRQFEQLRGERLLVVNLPRPVFALVLRASLAYYFLPNRLRTFLGALFVASTVTPELKSRILCDGITRVQADVKDLDLAESNGGVYSHRLGKSFDRVIACTGYRYALSTIGYLLPELSNKIQLNRLGVPALGFDFQTSVPNLYMIGGIAEPVHGPALRFMIGCRQATLRVSRALRE